MPCLFWESLWNQWYNKCNKDPHKLIHASKLYIRLIEPATLVRYWLVFARRSLESLHHQGKLRIFMLPQKRERGKQANEMHIASQPASWTWLFVTNIIVSKSHNGIEKMFTKIIILMRTNTYNYQPLCILRNVKIFTYSKHKNIYPHN